MYFNIYIVEEYRLLVILICFLLYKEGFSFYKNFAKIGWPGLIGGFCLGIAMTGFIFSITKTTAAVTLFMLATMPFIAAIIAYFILGEHLRRMSFHCYAHRFSRYMHYDL